jgi:hypothetical protein
VKTPGALFALGGAAVAVNSASPRTNAELEQAYLAELNRPEEEELFAEIERDWYENEEKSEGKESEGDDWEDIFGEEEGSVVESERFRDIMGLQFFANNGGWNESEIYWKYSAAWDDKGQSVRCAER